MSKRLITGRGLKYILPDNIYDDVEALDDGTNEIWYEINFLIESAELFDVFMSNLFFTLLVLYSDFNWISIIAITLVIKITAGVLSNCLFLFRIPILNIIFFINSFFIVRVIWSIAILIITYNSIGIWCGIIYILLEKIVDFALIRIIGTYEQREIFNIKVAKYVMKKYQ